MAKNNKKNKLLASFADMQGKLQDYTNKQLTAQGKPNITASGDPVSPVGTFNNVTEMFLNKNKGATNVMGAQQRESAPMATTTTNQAPPSTTDVSASGAQSTGPQGNTLYNAATTPQPAAGGMSDQGNMGQPPPTPPPAPGGTPPPSPSMDEQFPNAPKPEPEAPAPTPETPTPTPETPDPTPEAPKSDAASTLDKMYADLMEQAKGNWNQVQSMVNAQNAAMMRRTQALQGATGSAIGGGFMGAVGQTFLAGQQNLQGALLQHNQSVQNLAAEILGRKQGQQFQAEQTKAGQEFQAGEAEKGREYGRESDIIKLVASGQYKPVDNDGDGKDDTSGIAMDKLKGGPPAAEGTKPTPTVTEQSTPQDIVTALNNYHKGFQPGGNFADNQEALRQALKAGVKITDAQIMNLAKDLGFPGGATPDLMKFVSDLRNTTGRADTHTETSKWTDQSAIDKIQQPLNRIISVKGGTGIGGSNSWIGAGGELDDLLGDLGYDEDDMKSTDTLTGKQIVAKAFRKWIPAGLDAWSELETAMKDDPNRNWSLQEILRWAKGFGEG